MALGGGTVSDFRDHVPLPNYPTATDTTGPRGPRAMFEDAFPGWRDRLAAERQAGFDLAVAALRDEAAWRQWRRTLRQAATDHYVPGALTEAERNGAADYLAAVRTEVLGGGTSTSHAEPRSESAQETGPIGDEDPPAATTEGTRAIVDGAP